ncbi:MAG: barnase inhibitor [Chitinophagaceae bacterium]|nr:MAG: barnase inhibitor [Chitinophagaceae bacterium]
MKPAIVAIPVNEIVDWDSFHVVFARELGFPDFYGKNMNAWIDCMTSVDDPEDGLTSVHGTKEAGLLLNLGDCTEFAKRCPEQYEAILDSVGFVNHRRMEAGGEPVISLSFWNREPDRWPPCRGRFS